VDAEIDDAALMIRYGQGDLAAFEQLYARHKGPLYRYLLRQCRPRDAAADVFQEVWSRVIANRERYAVRATFRTWLYTIAQTCVIDHYRLRERKRADRMDSVDDHVDALVGQTHQQPEAEAAQSQLDQAFHDALERLPEDQRSVFLLFEESGLSLKEIAAVTGVPQETVKSRLRYALAKLRGALAPEFDVVSAAVMAGARTGMET
jgi:RNA polymerase sigma-70 factor (ECF subfamily)